LNRRFFLAAGALSLLAAKADAAPQRKARPPNSGVSANRLPPVKAATMPENWRHFNVDWTLEAERVQGEPVKLLLPLPLHQDTPTQLWQRVERLSWESEAQVSFERQPDEGVETLVGEWATAKTPRLRLATALFVADRTFDISRRTFAPEREDILRKNLAATPLLPVDEVARTLAKSITGRIIEPLAEAHALYDWIVEKSVFDTTMPDNDGHGDIGQQIASQHYGGDAADISGLFVLLARAIGIPARRVPGFFIAPSQLSPALGMQSANAELSALLHCRAEFYAPGYHWIPVDPAGVCRVAALNPAPADSANTLNAVKRLLFGFWEMNWLALNYAEGETLINRPHFSPQTNYRCQIDAALGN